MLGDDRNVYGLLQEVIYRETVYLRHYLGEVVDRNDPLSKGRVRVRVDELGFDTAESAFWCWPRVAHGADVPAAGEWVEVWFLGGSRNRAVYLGGVPEISSDPAGTPAAYSGPDLHVLFQDPDTGDQVSYDAAAQRLLAQVKELLVTADSVQVGDGSESFVKGDSLYSFMQSLMTWLGSHVHGGVSSGGSFTVAPTGAPSMSDFRSAKVKGE